VRKADNLPPSCAVVTKSGNLNFLEPSGPLRAFNGTNLPLPLPLPVSFNLVTKVVYGVKLAKSLWSFSLKHLFNSACGQPKQTFAIKMIEV